nr:hypothetical protein [uncultured Flavonifractor sp.]
MKRLSAVSALALILLLLRPVPASANMAAPADPDVGSSITFERNDALAVTEEVLDIRVTGATAEITAVYSMVNVTDQPVSTPVMFLAPNTGDGGVEVKADGACVPCSIEQYVLDHAAQITAQDWRYAVLSRDADADPDGERVDGISFQLDFGPGEAYEVSVSYPYRLGGYPAYDYNVKRGEILYYLSPAALWRDFQSLTINLYLDRDMPVLASSNLDFEEVGPRTYQYRSDSLPEGELEIQIDQNEFQEFIGTLRSPYLLLYLIFLGPIVLLVAAIIVVPVVIRRQAKGSRR